MFDGDKRKFIEDHLKTLELTKELNGFYEPIVFIQFLVSSVTLCLLGFQLIMLENFYQRLVILLFASAFIVQVFVYCFAGQLIQDKSSSVAEDFYACEKDFILIIARSRKAEFVRAGFFRVNLVTFTSIMNSAISMITLLKSLL
jgi:odorant receptor